MSVNFRNEAGDLLSNRGPKFNTLNFDLDYLENTTDQPEFNRIMRGSGITIPLFISLFPEDTDLSREQSHQIYGKLSEISKLNYTLPNIYTTKISLEEV
jgi:hypothetical protein